MSDDAVVPLMVTYRLTIPIDLSQLNGGAIHNIGLAAAHLAAATSSGRVTTAHVVRATQRELQKTGRPADSVAFGPLGELLNGARVNA